MKGTFTLTIVYPRYADRVSFRCKREKQNATRSALARRAGTGPSLRGAPKSATRTNRPLMTGPSKAAFDMLYMQRKTSKTDCRPSLRQGASKRPVYRSKSEGPGTISCAGGGSSHSSPFAPVGVALLDRWADDHGDGQRDEDKARRVLKQDHRVAASDPQCKAQVFFGKTAQDQAEHDRW